MSDYAKLSMHQGERDKKEEAVFLVKHELMSCHMSCFPIIQKTSKLGVMGAMWFSMGTKHILICQILKSENDNLGNKCLSNFLEK